MRPDGTVQEWTEISEPRPTLRKVFLNCNFSPAWNICFIKARYYKCPISKNSICSDINLKESKRTSLIYEIYLQCHPRLMGNDNYLSPTRPSLISFSGPFFSLNYLTFVPVTTIAGLFDNIITGHISEKFVPKFMYSVFELAARTPISAFSER